MRTATLLVGLALGAGLAHAGEIRLGSLSLDWPAGYTLKSTQSPFELRGPGGAKVLVTVMRPRSSPSGSVEDLAKRRGPIEQLLTQQAAKAGKVVVPLAADTLPDGTQLLSIGSEAAGLFKTSYLLQFALVARSGRIALVTVEGQGGAAAEHQAVSGVFRSARWEDDGGSAAEQAAFTERVAAMLRAQPATAAVVIAEPLTLKVGELQANLDRVYRFCRIDAAGCDDELKRYVQAVVDVQTQPAAPVTRESLRAVVRTSEFADGVTRSMGAKGAPMTRPLADGFVAMSIIDSPRSARLLVESDAKALGLSSAQVYELAMTNLRQALGPLKAQPAKRGEIGTLQGDFYESGRVLLHDDWAPLAKAQQGVLVVALPSKDVVLFSADDSPAGLDALRMRARDIARTSASQLSDLLLRWTDAGWQTMR